MTNTPDAKVFGELRRGVLTTAISDYCEKELVGAMADVGEQLEHHSTGNVDLSELGIPVEDPAQITAIALDFDTIVCEDDGVHDGQQHLTVRVVAGIDVEGNVFTADYASEEDADLSGVDFDERYTEVTRSKQATLVFNVVLTTDSGQVASVEFWEAAK